MRSVGHRLRSLERIKESIKPLQLALSIYKTKDQRKAEITASDLIEPYLTIGNVKTALKMSEAGVKNSYSSDKKSDRRLYRVTIYARTLHQAGKKESAREFFQEAEKIQQEINPSLTYLTKLPGFLYSEFLLEDNQVFDAKARAKELLYTAQASNHNLFIGLSKLILGRSYLLQSNSNAHANRLIEEALIALREANDQDHLPRGLLVRASLYRFKRQFDNAHKDLDEVLGIAKPNGMRLHLTDYHLEMARLLLAEELGGDGIHHHFTAAERLINETGYHRRDKELAELKAYLQ